MPMRKLLGEAAVFQPEEIDFLTKVFDATMFDGEDEAERENRASRIIANYQIGIRDEAELIELSTASRPLKRGTGPACIADTLDRPGSPMERSTSGRETDLWLERSKKSAARENQRRRRCSQVG